MTDNGVHHQAEGARANVNFGNHPDRTESSGYKESRTLMGRLVKEAQPWWFGPGEYQDHHGGGIWLKDENGWFHVLGLAGIEWAAQFCADPAKVDQLRLATRRLVAGFPETIPGYETLEYDEATKLLDTPITDPPTISAWTDGIFNASVPLPASMHTGFRPKGAGYHHYPKPIVDILTFKHDDFELFVDDDEGKPVAVTPKGQRGSGDGRVRVAWATPDSHLDQRRAASEAKGEPLILPANHRIAQAAFRNQ